MTLLTLLPVSKMREISKWVLPQGHHLHEQNTNSGHWRLGLKPTTTSMSLVGVSYLAPPRATVITGHLLAAHSPASTGNIFPAGPGWGHPGSCGPGAGAAMWSLVLTCQEGPNRDSCPT